MTKLDVVGFGALNVDKLYRVNRIANVEEESFIQEQEEACGGSAANTIVGLARLGCKVGFIGKTGYDRESEMQIKEFRKEGVNLDGITRCETGKSGSVLSFVDKKGQRALYINPGLNDTIDSSNVRLDYASNAQFLHLTSFVGDMPLRAQKKLLGLLPKDVKISLDPGDLYARRGFAQLSPFIRRAHVVMPNSAELKLLTGETDYVKGADVLIAEGAKIVAVKLGSRGCFVTDGQERNALDAFEADVVDTTGAGDAFCAGFLYGLLNRKDLYDCGRLGNFVASRKVTKMGAREGLPYKTDLNLLD
jgi:ribokinase